MKYLKDRKIPLYQQVPSQDKVGAVHYKYQLIGNYWAHYKPISITTQTGAAAVHEIADVCFTINKPSWFNDDTLVTDLYTIYRHRVYKVTRIEDVEGKTRGDVRLFMQQAKMTNEDRFLSKVID